ncbi:TolC family outer membrane protein [Desulfosoma sp.]
MGVWVGLSAACGKTVPPAAGEMPPWASAPERASKAAAAPLAAASAPNAARHTVAEGPTAVEPNRTPTGEPLSVPSDTAPLGLLEALRRARANDPALRSAFHEYQAARTLTDQARASLLPLVQGSVGLTEIGYVKAPLGYEDYWSESEGVGLRQPLFNVSAYVSLDQSRKRVQAAQARYQETADQLLYRVCQAYLNVVYAEEYLAVVREQEKTLAEQRTMAQRLFQAGEGTITDVHDAEARYADILYQLTDAEKLRTTARRTLELLMGGPAGPLRPLGPELTPTPPEPSAVEAWLDAARAHSPVLRYYRLGVDVAEDEILKAHSLHLPTLDFSATYARRNTIGEYTPSRPVEYYATGIQLTVPVFSGGYATAKTREATERKAQSEEDYRRALSDITQKITEAFYGVEASRSKIGSLAQAVRANETAVASTRRAFEAGLRSIVDVLNAQTNLYRAKVDWVRARHEYVLNLVSLHYHSGRLTDALMETIDSWLERNTP